MPKLSSFEFATIRVVPRVEREEFLNAGVVLFCLEQRFLGAKIHLDSNKLAVFGTEAPLDSLREHLQAISRVCEGDPGAGPIALLTIRERFQWLVSPRSTVIQVSPVHSGMCEAAAPMLDALFARLVL